MGFVVNYANILLFYRIFPGPGVRLPDRPETDGSRSGCGAMAWPGRTPAPITGPGPNMFR